MKEGRGTCQKTDTLLRCPKNTERGAGKQEKVRTQQLLREQKLVRDSEMMAGGRKEKTDVPRNSESTAL